MPDFARLPPLSLYIHIPWCVRKCPYCDFNSHQAEQKIPEQAYIQALLQDLDEELALVQGRPLQSIFFGGGTPSLFSAEGIDAILTGVGERIDFTDTIEITLEANPGTVEQQRFEGYAKAGINRLSIGVQSFQQPQLTALGRIHDASEAITAAQAAIHAGISNFNIDLMHGLPGQEPEQALADLQQAVALSPTHLSWYQLTIEKNTAFYKHPPQLPEEDILFDIQHSGEAFLQQQGFNQYEVSAYSQADKQAAHNLNYWQFGDYIGIGTGAHGKLTDLDRGLLIRRQKTRLPDDYLNERNRFCSLEKISSDDEVIFEFMLNALRLNQGFSHSLFSERTGPRH